MLNVYTDGNRVISATPKVAPTVDELPELDITADISSDLNTKQNPDGIGATPKVAPTADKLPTLNPDEVEQPLRIKPSTPMTPRVDVPILNQPNVEQPKVEQPKVEQPKAEQPKS